MKKIIIAFMIMLYIVPSVWAAPIVGNITFGGVLDPLIDLSTTNDITITGPVFITSTSGDFSALSSGSIATFFNFSFDPLTSGTTLWNAGPFSFALHHISIIHQSALGLVLQGDGVMSRGLDNSPYDWSFSANRTNTIVSFAETNSHAVVPESTTLTFLVIGIGLVLVGRYLQ